MLRAIRLSHQESDEELDFIINNDIKYRMGDDLSGDGDEELNNA